MSIKALQDYTYYSKYARYNKKAKRRETWGEAVDRVKNMHLTKYAENIEAYPEIREQIEWAFEQSRQKRVLGSQRALQFGGDPILKVNARIYNCCFSFCDRIKFFQEAFWLLLCGSGTGFSVQEHHVAKLPDFTKKIQIVDGKLVYGSKLRHLIPDSIEGWADALGVLLACYMPHQEFPNYEGRIIEFDYSLIRKAGSTISSGSGKAPGPEPLRRSLETIKGLLERRMFCGNRLRTIDAYDIIMHASDAVLSGGVRRSATICLFSPSDKEMIAAKTGNWFNENPQRGRSNNSALLLRNSTTKEEFSELIESVKQFGEPGFVWSDSTELGVNPCVEVGFWPVDAETGETGWQFCVAADTKLLTKNGIVDIIDAVGQEVDIWNGMAWKKATPFKTGSDRKLYRVHIGDGSFLDCTANHKWLVKDRFSSEYKEVETKDLMSCSKYAVHTPPPAIKWEGEIVEPNAYEMGFVLGDGCCNRNDTVSKYRTPIANLFKNDQMLRLNCRVVSESHNENGTPFKRVSFDQLSPDRCWHMKYGHGLPKEIFSWDRKSCYDFIAGWMDADGSAAGRGFRIYGRHDKLFDLQLLFTKLGFYSSLNLVQKKDEETNVGIRRQDLWYVQVSDVGDLYSRRLKIEQTTRIGAGRGQWQVIEKVDELPGLHDTFCLTEDEKHQCVFNNVLTKQCNLSEQNGRKIKSREDWIKAATAGAIIGTLQAGYTDFEYLGDTSKKITERESLLGVSITGMMDNPDILFNAAMQREMAELILKINAELAPKLGIRPAARATCIKPSGTASCVLGTGSGIHPHHAKKYLRRVQGNNMEAPLQWFKQFNPHAVEKSVWSANGTDEVISFCVEVPEGGKVKNDLDALSLLEHVKITQQNWVAYGCVKDRCTQPWLMNNVSNTINVKPEEWDDVRDKIYDNRMFYAGVSLLPISGDKDYPQAPMCAIYSGKEILQKYGEGSMFASGLIVDGLKAYNNNLWAACESVMGLNPLVEPVFTGDELNYQEMAQFLRDKRGYESMLDWMRRAKQFADRYFEGDVRNMTYCLKDVSNLHCWNNLKRLYQDVDYTLMMEESDETKPNQEWACSGQSCEMR